MEGVGDALVEERLDLGPRTVAILRPPDPEALLDEEAFEHEEFLPYWAELWPSGLALARHVAARSVAGQSVLELGCGLGLPSLAAALGGARVLAADWAPAAVELLRANATRNGADLEAVELDWTQPGRLLAGPWDVVLAADVLYERRNADALLELLASLDAHRVLVADPGRPAARDFFDRARGSWRLGALAAPEARVRIYELLPSS